MTGWASRAADLLEPPSPVSQEEVFGRLGYVPTPRQWEFHRATEDDVLYGGAAGGGKSRCAVMHAIWACMAYPNISVAIFRRTYDELAESILPALAKVSYCDMLGATWHGTEKELRFPNGARMRLRYLESLVDASRRQGGEYQLLVFDERTLLPPGAADQVAERLRSGNPDIPVLGLRSTSNPGGSSHGDVKRRYIDATDHGARTARDSQGHTIRFIKATVDDNPHVDAGYKARLDAIPDPSRRKAMRDGDWDSFSGQVFTEWNHERHVVQPFTLPASWQRYVGIDWGYTAPWAAIWMAEDEDRRIYVYRELYAAGVGEHEQARSILAAEEGDPSPIRVCDPAMWAKRGDAESIATAYMDEGCYVEPANNDRMAGWQQVHHYLSDGPACTHHRALGWTECPRLHIFPQCANLIRCIPVLPYSSIRTEDVDTKSDADHAPDALRYALMALGSPQTMVFASPALERDERIKAGMSPMVDGLQPHRDFGPFALAQEDGRPPGW